jgi:hypothetical protein
VGSYPTISPLPGAIARDVGGILSVALSVGDPKTTAQALPGSVPNGARTFLGATLSRARDATVRPASRCTARNLAMRSNGTGAIARIRCAGRFHMTGE